MICKLLDNDHREIPLMEPRFISPVAKKKKKFRFSVMQAVSEKDSLGRYVRSDSEHA